MIFMSIVFMFPNSPTTTTQDMNYTVDVLGGVMLLSVVWYFFPKYGGVYWFTGPVPNILGLEGSMDGAGHEAEKKSTSSVVLAVGSEDDGSVHGTVIGAGMSTLALFSSHSPDRGLARQNWALDMFLCGISASWSLKAVRMKWDMKSRRSILHP